MRMSCNGCRVLRKGCSESCSIRPCLQWIKSSESQANATVFLAKFYGRAGLMNLINAGPEHLRPAIFRSLLYEACGRIVNPIYGSVGLLWSGNWPLCQAAVEAVLKGVPISPINSEVAADGQCPPLKAYDIRHVSKDENSAAFHDPNNKAKARGRTRGVVKPKAERPGAAVIDMGHEELTRSTSHESSVSPQSAADAEESKETESMLSVETAEVPLLLRADLESTSVAVNNKGQAVNNNSPAGNEMAGLGLELTLGLEPTPRACHTVPLKKRKVDANTCKVELGLDFTRVN